jgi:hypothetical protein
MRRLLLLPALALAGCGAAPSSATDFEGEQRAVAEAIEDIQDAGERADTTRLCEDLFAARLRDTVRQGAGSCVAEVDSVINDADDFDLDVRSVEISGNTARAVVESESNNETVRSTFEMVKEGGAWKAAAVSGP